MIKGWTKFYLGVRDEMLVREMESVGRWSSQVCTGCVVEQKSAWGVHYRCMGWSKMLFKDRLIATKVIILCDVMIFSRKTVTF